MKGSGYWVAFVVGVNMETGKKHYSFLAFNATNRFNAMRAIEQSLPENPEYIRPDGTLIPHQTVLLQQIKPELHSKYLECFIETVEELHNNASISHVA